MQVNQDIAGLAGLSVGILLLLWGGYALATTSAENASDCVPACVIEGVQYKPLPHGGACWCDMKKGRALTVNP